MKVSIERRRLCQLVAAAATGVVMPGVARAANEVTATRVWPAREYTRLTIETAAAATHQLLVLKNPDRLALDLEGIASATELQAVAAKVGAEDPYIRAVRVGWNRPGVLRLVLDLKAEVSPQLFALLPAGDYGHRLVLDLYPAVPFDPLMAFLEAEQRGLRATDEELRGGEPANRPGGGRDADIRRRPITIAIDPGHGGEDPGAIGRAGTYEKHVALAIARRLKSVVDDERGMRAMLTRDDDYYVPLATRVHKARRVRADLFISIHADAFRTPTVRGASVFALSERGATSAAARWLAQRENGADLIGGVNLGIGDPLLAKTLLDLSQSAAIHDSLKVGRIVLEEIAEVNALHKPQVEQAGFAVLKAPDIPSILVETAFISNPDEERKLRSERYQAQMARSIHEGVRRYFAQNPPIARNEVT